MTTHYSYLRDPANPKRVITVARKIEGDFIHFGIAVCRPDEVKVYTYGSRKSREDSYITSKGDVFRKKMGRLIAEGRMVHKQGLKVSLVEGEHPMLTIAKSLVDYGHGHVPEFVMRTFSAYVFGEKVYATGSDPHSLDHKLDNRKDRITLPVNLSVV